MVLEQIQEAVETTNKDLARVEQIKKFTVLPRNFSIEDGELTPTLKVKRKKVYEHFAPRSRRCTARATRRKPPRRPEDITLRAIPYGIWLCGAALSAALFVAPTPCSAQPEEQPTAEEPAGHDGGTATERIEALRRSAEETTIVQRLTSFVGVFLLVGLAWTMSTNRKLVPWRVIGWGTGLQLLFGVLVLKTSAGLALFAFLNDAVTKLLEFTTQGSKFLFGNFVDSEFTVALNVLPTIIFFSSLMAVLYHAGVMQKAVAGIAWLMRRTMGTSGSETLSVAANIFVGQTEAPLLVRPFVETMTRSELNSVMVGGFATVAGGVLAAYVGMLRDVFPDIAGHLIAASVMSAPAAMVVAKVMVPETEESPTRGEVKLEIPKVDANVIDAAARGAADGLQLALNVGAMLLAFLALVALADYVVGLPGHLINDAVGHIVVPDLSIAKILGWLFWPIAFVMGTPVQDCTAVASLLGEKMVLNEFVAYLHLSESLNRGDHMSYRAVVITTYALCGFANFGSIAIQIGGIGGMAPKRRSELARLGLRAMIGGMIAACMTAAVAGVLI